MKDYYKILRLHQSVSAAEVQEAYRRLAHKYHPDKGGDADKFSEINEAYVTLSDPKKRAEYDSVFSAKKSGADFQPQSNSQDKKKFTLSVLYPVIAGIVFWILGDSGGTYNATFVIIGWLFIIYAVFKYSRS